MITSSEELGQGLLVIVHLSMYVLPLVPVKVEVGLDVLLNEPPVPLTFVHLPVPTVGVFAASVAVVPQTD